MPEIKNTFVSGKMNKDLDERLIPKDGYVDAMNIQVATSEDSDVGTAQNILGNRKLSIQGVSIPDHATTVASIADEKNDKLYYFVWTLDVDYIFEHSRLSNNPIAIFVDSNKDVLKFDPLNIITGINIIDDMLFWTDNVNEPRKINIPRCKQGTPLITNHTKLINSPQQQLPTITAGVISALEDIKEEHITVIKKAPKKPLDITVNTSRDPNKIYTGVIQVARESNQQDSSFTAGSGMYDFSSVETGTDRGISQSQSGDTFIIFVTRGISQIGAEVPIGDINQPDGLTGWHSGPNTGVNGNNAIAIGTKFVIAPYDDDDTPPGLPLTDYLFKGVVMDYYPNTDANTGDIGLMVKIISQVGVPQIPSDNNSTLNYVIDLWDEQEKLFEFKFPRFSYRYKFEDGEYSPFAPFTQVAFVPGSFDYHPRKGYNLGMTNRATSIDLTRIITPQTPIDIVSIDILFKDEVSPNIYVVDTISPDDYEAVSGSNLWNTNKGVWSSGIASIAYTITKETIQNTVPSNQLLRPWDNVPRKALAQDVTGNRIVYGNYVQNYDLKTSNGKKYVPNMSVYWASTISGQFKDDGLETSSFNITSSQAQKSIKSLREYQLGVVFTDEYGRETPVISNTQGSIKLEKERADKFNRFQVQLKELASKPEGMTHMKFYVKETAGEYYNMAMDRFYDAEDGNVWLAFPSSDRNKIDIDTFLILKKGSDQDTLVKDVARYKVIAIENEAPDFIKTSKLLGATVKHSTTGGLDLFTAGQLPLIGRDDFKLSYSPFSNGPGRNLDVVTDSELYIEFSIGGQFSERYRITSITQDFSEDVGIAAAQFSIQLEKPLEADVNFISNDPTGSNSTSINNGVTVNIYKYKVENTPKFDGRFFVKIFLDEVFTENIGKSFIEGLDFRTTSSKMVYSMSNRDEHIEKHFNTPNSGVRRFLTDGVGITANNFNSSGAFSYASDTINRSYGYYGVDEFAAMSIYFRRLTRTNAAAVQGTTNFNNRDQDLAGRANFTPFANIPLILPLAKKTASSAGAIEYKGEYWNWNDIAFSESVSYTSHWLLEGSQQFGTLRYEERVHQVGADNPIETDVWFIDAGPAAAFRSTNEDLSWNYLSGSFESLGAQALTGGSLSNLAFSGAQSTGTIEATGYENTLTDSGGYQNQNGLTVSASTGNWSMAISYGGIFGCQDAVVTDNFFNFANWFTANGAAQNPYYTNSGNSKNTSFTQNFQPGAQFRWREDPTETIYTIPDLSRKNLIRHSARNSKYVGGQAIDYVGGAVSMAEHLSPNFTSGFLIKNVPEQLAWNPVQEGQLTGSMVITLAAADSSGSITGSGSTCDGVNLSDQLKIYVSTLTGTNTGGGDAEEVLLPGMALSAYFKAASSADLVTNLGPTSNEFLVITEINTITGGFELVLAGYSKPLIDTIEHTLASTAKPLVGTNYTFVQVGMNGYSHNSEFNINTIGRDSGRCGAIGAVGYHLDFVEAIEPTEVLSDNPAIFETEPKEIKELDIYYEASPSIPLTITTSNIHEAVPLGSKIINLIDFNIQMFLVVDYTADGKLVLANPSVQAQASSGAGFSNSFVAGSSVLIRRPDGVDFSATIISSSTVNISIPGQPAFHGHLEIDTNMYTNSYELAWHNCYSFQNGVESNRIRDNFNLPFISNGVRVSTTLETEYKEERRKYGLIYSGLYNSTGGINNLNQFVQAEKITKDINPIYGSIQKLYSRDSDLVTLCEDKVLKILANKDAVFNADGNTNLTATANVLGQTIPFSGEYGISTNPESFASENYRAYFSDKVRGAILRLSKDGLTPISEAGMKDWFRDNLKISNRVIGSFDDRNNEYNIKLEKLQGAAITYSQDGTPDYSSTFFLNENLNTYNFYQILGALGVIATPYSDLALIDQSQVLTFKERTKGWVSFKSFTEMQLGVSMANDYYTFYQGGLHRHNAEDMPRNTFYTKFKSSTIDVMLNDSPSDIKVFHTLNYEGSSGKVDKFESTSLSLPYQNTSTYTDQETYNLTDKQGWFTKRIITDKEEGYINEFLEKEGKWFNNIKKCVNPLVDQSDTADFSFQGIGFVPTSSYGVTTVKNPTGFSTWSTTDIDTACVISEEEILEWPVLIVDTNIPFPGPTVPSVIKPIKSTVQVGITSADETIALGLAPVQTPTTYITLPNKNVSVLYMPPAPSDNATISTAMIAGCQDNSVHDNFSSSPNGFGGNPSLPLQTTDAYGNPPGTQLDYYGAPWISSSQSVGYKHDNYQPDANTSIDPATNAPIVCTVPSFGGGVSTPKGAKSAPTSPSFQSAPSNYRSAAISSDGPDVGPPQPSVVDDKTQEIIFSDSQKDKQDAANAQQLEKLKKEQEQILANEIEKQNLKAIELEKAKSKTDIYTKLKPVSKISKEKEKEEEELLRKRLEETRRRNINPSSGY